MHVRLRVLVGSAEACYVPGLELGALGSLCAAQPSAPTMRLMIIQRWNTTRCSGHVHPPPPPAHSSKKPFRDFSKKKRHLLAWSLRAASTPDEDHNGSGGSKAAPEKSVMRRSRSVPSNLPGDAHVEVTDDLAQWNTRRRRRRDRSDVDVDTLPNLAPYRHEVVAQKSITFGHRPASGSRMFNPSTMATSFAAGGGGGGGGGSGGGGRGGGGLGEEVRRGNAGGTRRNHKLTRTPPSLRKGRARRVRRSPGLSASMLREILLGGEDQRGESTRFSGIGGSVSATVGANGEVSIGHHGSVEGREARGKPHGVPGSRNAVEDLENELSGALNSSVSRSVGPGGGGVPGVFDAIRLARSGRAGTRRHEGGREEGTRQGLSFDEIELRRIFAADVSIGFLCTVSSRFAGKAGYSFGG